ncbi:AAA family ATPase [Symbiobacterium terraclitae]|uniref:AAA family ATPase n=1 Tax=Symbiobacterium terraclitae TaxID=557451 RepID=UPI0035B53B2F
MIGSVGKPTWPAIDKITVAGFKSIRDKRSIDVAPLTVLSGANSSGKSSIMQAVLLLKQTVEAPYDPGALLLSGPNVRFTSAKQMLSVAAKPGDAAATGFSVGLGASNEYQIDLHFSTSKGTQGFSVKKSSVAYRNLHYTLTDNMEHEDLLQFSPFKELVDRAKMDNQELKLRVTRQRCFLMVSLDWQESDMPRWTVLPGSVDWDRAIRQIIHIPGLRGNPERTYARSAVSSFFPGTFDQYVASIIAAWQTSKNQKQLGQLDAWLEMLGLTSQIRAKSLNDTQVELRVGRLLRSRNIVDKDTVSIADVGFGVSQCLPILVALLAARPGQLVYVEQPELHLHPKAQVRLVEVFREAVARGVRLIIETHSLLLLRAIQWAVAEDRLSPKDVKLHWFQRDPKTGVTDITSADLDEAGAHGDWPNDFAEVALKLEMAYLGAAERKVLGKS